MAAGLAIRLLILSYTGDLQPQIIDEQHYLQIARNLAAGHGFGWGPGDLTSLRPPLYPSILAVAWRMWDAESLQVVRLFQILLSLAIAGLVYLLGLRVWDARVGRLGALIAWLYPSFIFGNFLLLTETLFTFLLVAFVLLAVMLVQRPVAALAVACGVTLGLGALARSVLWPLPLLFCPLLFAAIPGPLGRRLLLPVLVLAGFTAVVGPWAARNTRLQGVVTIVDTMGGMNLRMGNYEHTPDDRMWDAVALGGEKNWTHGIEADFPGQRVTEGQKEKWAQRKALEYMRAHPIETLRRSLIKFADFWGLEREFMAGVRSGFFRVPLWFAALASIAIVASYVAVSVTGMIGIWLAAPRTWRTHALLLLPIVLIMGVHTIVFGHSRYHLPLIPLLGLYGAAWARLSPVSSPAASRMSWLGAVLSVVVLGGVWIRQVIVTDLQRITSWLGQ